MEPNPHPVKKQGYRNLHCFHYGGCLDHAVKHRWQCWNCSECLHKSSEEPTDAVRTVHDSNLIYELPYKLSREVWHRFG